MCKNLSGHGLLDAGLDCMLFTRLFPWYKTEDSLFHSFAVIDSPIGEKQMEAKMPLNLTILCVFLTFWAGTSVFA